MQSIFGGCRRLVMPAAWLLLVAGLTLRSAEAALVYGFRDKPLLFDTESRVVWLPVDATAKEVSLYAEHGRLLRFAKLDELAGLFAGNFDVPIPANDYVELDRPLDEDLVRLILFLGGALSDSCVFGQDQCYVLSGWMVANPRHTYDVYRLEYSGDATQSAIGDIWTIGGYPRPAPCPGGVDGVCSDTRLVVMSPVPLPPAAWLLASALAAAFCRRRR
jgi:hypothetical protein